MHPTPDRVMGNTDRSARGRAKTPGQTNTSRSAAAQRFRHQGIALAIEAWFALNQRPLPWRDSYDPYLVWVSEVMLQQTRMEVVVGYYSRFIQRFPDVWHLAVAAEDDVVAALSGLGYYRRARMFHSAAKQVVEHHGGQIPSSFDELSNLAGVGRYTAGAIASIGFDLPYPVVDGNVTRLLARVGDLDAPVGSASLQHALWDLAGHLVSSADSPRALNQGMMELGAAICKPRNPECPSCPLESLCLARGRGLEATRPVRPARRASVDVVIPLYVIENDRGEVLMLRTIDPLMKSMLHLPHGSDALLPSAAISAPGIVVKKRIGSVRHTVTHRRLEFEVSICDVTGGSVAESAAEAFWINPERLQEHPHPSYVAKALRLWRSRKQD